MNSKFLVSSRIHLATRAKLSSLKVLTTPGVFPSVRSQLCRGFHGAVFLSSSTTPLSSHHPHPLLPHPHTQQSPRHISTSVIHRSPADPPVPPPPPPPTIPPIPAETATDMLQTSSQDLWAADAARILAEGETFASLGLGGYSPVGLIQSSMELIHNTTGLPWWGSIVLSTLCLRLLFIPVNIYLQKNAIKMHNVNPEIEKMKEKQQVYMLAGNLELANHERNKMNAVFKKHGIRPVLSVMPAIFQGVFMVSFFMALRGMANAPVTGMMAGGLLWFPDLTVPDPSFMLPVISSAGFLISLELGGDAGVVNPQMEKFKYAMRFLAVLMIAFTAKFPAGVFMYWLTSTVFSIANALLLKLPTVRRGLGLGDKVLHKKPADAPAKNDFTAFASWSEKRKVRMKVAEMKRDAKMATKHYEKLKKGANVKLYDTPPPKTSKA